MRRDLPLGVLAAQLTHAAGESSERIPSGTYAVVLSADNESHILKIESKLVQLGIEHHAVREPDEPWNGALMAIGISPTKDRSMVRPVTRALRLLK